MITRPVVSASRRVCTAALVPAVVLLALMVLFPGVAVAQASGGQGAVFDAGSGAPIPGAVLTLRGPDGRPSPGTVQVDSDGRFAVPRSWPGERVMEVRALGYRTATLSVAEATSLDWRIGLAADPLELEQMVVTASGRAQRLADVAVPIDRITAEEIRVASAPSAEALLAEIPGLQTVSAAPVGSNIMIRGIGDARVLVLVDGQPAGGALLENRDLGRMSLAGVERIEVVKGPLSSRYGSDALGGVINVITRAPEQGLGVEARVLGGGQGRLEADATVSGGGALLYRATGSWRQENEVPGLDRSTDVFSRVWDARVSARHHGGGEMRLRSDLVFVRERQRWPVGGGFSGFNDNRGLTGWVEVSWDRGPGTWMIRGFGQDYEHLYRSARGDAPIAGGDQELQDERLWKAAVGYVVSTDSHEIDVGVETSRRAIQSPDKILEDRASDDQFEVYAQDTWRLGVATLSGGARLTLNDRWGDTWSPSLGLVLMPGHEVRFRATVGRGFRAPSFKELAWDFANVGAGYVVQGYADLEPEVSWSGSMGLDWSPASAFSVTAEAYTNEIETLIEFAFTGSNPSGLSIYSPRNVARARTRGFEVSSGWRPGPHRIQAEYAFLDARSLDDDQPLDRRARHSGRLRVGTDLEAVGGLSADLTGHFTGVAPVVGADGGGGTTVVGERERLVSWNAQLSLPMPSLRARLLLGVDNLFDARPDGWDAPLGRRLRVGLEATLF